MKNPAAYIREKLVALLHETITYASTPVPCYEGEGEVIPYQILLAGQVKTNRHNRHAFNWRCEQRIEVISEQTTNLHKHVDAIAASVLVILKPTPRLSAFTGNVDFRVINVDLEFRDYIDEPSGEGTMINRLPLVLTFLLGQRTYNGSAVPPGDGTTPGSDQKCCITIVDTYADMMATEHDCIYQVMESEVNNGELSYYIKNGSRVDWIPAQNVAV